VADTITFRISGADQFVVQVGAWRDRLRREVHEAAGHESRTMALAMQQQYPLGKTGALRRGVRIVDDRPSGQTVRWLVKSLAPHSHLYEAGTAVRRTRHGANRGRVKPHPLFIPEAIRERVAFKSACRQILGSPEPALGVGSPTLTGDV
jgi:hypothetical protein